MLKKTTSYLIFFLIFIFLNGKAFAQKQIVLGVRFNPQSTSFQYETLAPANDFLKLTPYYFRVRPAVGIGATYQAFKHWGVGADLLYSMQGGGYEARKTNINYIKIPLWFRYNTSNDRRLIVNFQAGVDLAWMASAKLKYQDGETINIINYANRFNWGASVALGVKFKILKSYYINTQVFLYKDFRTLSKTSSEFKVTDYVFPGIRLSIDKQIQKKD